MPLTNPFAPQDADRAAIWEMLVSRDTEAFIAADWELVEHDFLPDQFIGINAQRSANPDDWQLGFPDLETYKNEWLRQAVDFGKEDWKSDPLQQYLQITTLEQIEIRGNLALAHKKFSGAFEKANGEKLSADWQSVYYCRRVSDGWKITGFTGYLPHFSAEPLVS